MDPVWTGIYPSWDEACKVARTIGDEGLGSDRWLQRISRQLTGYRNELREFGTAMPPRPSSLPFVCAMAATGSILDFGGSSGWCWDYLQNAFPGNEVHSYVVVETEEVVGYMRGAGLQDLPVVYRTLGDAQEACDLLYCNSVLQYFETNAPLIALLERTNPQVVLLDDLVAANDDDFYSVQRYWEGAIPYRFLGLRKLLQDLSSLGYSESVRHPYASSVLGTIGPLEMGNFPKARRLRHSLSILLRKSGAGRPGGSPPAPAETH